MLPRTDDVSAGYQLLPSRYEAVANVKRFRVWSMNLPETITKSSYRFLYARRLLPRVDPAIFGTTHTFLCCKTPVCQWQIDRLCGVANGDE